MRACVRACVRKSKAKISFASKFRPSKSCEDGLFVARSANKVSVGNTLIKKRNTLWKICSFNAT